MNREALNKVSWVKLTNGAVTSDNWFTAYLLSPITISAQNVFADIATPSVGVFETVIMNSIFGKAPAFDMSRKLAFQGVTGSGLELQTRLKLSQDNPDPIEDFDKPLRKLILTALPKRTSASLYGTVKAMVDEGHEGEEEKSIGKLLIGTLGAIADQLITWGDALSKQMLSKMLKDTYFLDIPEQLQSSGCYAYFGDVTKTPAIKMGPFIIKAIQIQLGPLILTGGYPEYVNVNITLEPQRTYTCDMMTNLFTKAERRSPEDPKAPLAK